MASRFNIVFLDGLNLRIRLEGSTPSFLSTFGFFLLLLFYNRKIENWSLGFYMFKFYNALAYLSKKKKEFKNPSLGLKKKKLVESPSITYFFIVRLQQRCGVRFFIFLVFFDE
jgi:hypothetical protein